VIREGRMRVANLYPRLEELLAEVEARLEQVWEEEGGFLGRAARRALSGRGKRLRPSLLLLSAECAGRATESSVRLASLVEVVHTASLVHDDVVDGAVSRRGRRSANALWGNKISVLLGDYLIAQAFDLMLPGDRERFVPECARVAKRMCEGQVKELRGARRRLGEREYLEVVRAKTGSLFGFCGRAGAESGGGSEELAEALEGFGERFGVAFQLADDILDLVGSDGRSGKPERRDLAEGKWTLPLILAAEHGGRVVRGRLERMLEGERVAGEEMALAREMAEASGAIAAAWERVGDWLGAARERLETVPESAAKQALMMIAGERFPSPVMS